VHWFRFLHTVSLALFTLVTASCATRPKPAAELPPQRYLRTVNDTNGTVALEVAVRSFAPRHGRGPVVWLVGVTHLGDTNYYAGLQHFLDRQPLVLFEGIGATNKQFRMRGDHGFSLQDELAGALGLEFQLNAIDYSGANFRNADLSLAQLNAIFSRGTNASAGTRAASGQAEFNQLIQTMEGTGLFGGLARIGISLIRASPRLQAAMKVALIETLGALPDDLSQSPAMTPGLRQLVAALIEARNRNVIANLQAALRAHPRPASVAVFYGAGHMADLERRVRAILHYRPTSERWLTAFAVNPRAAGLSEWELDLTRRMVRQELKALQPQTNAPAAKP
jgi:hypothetical protein